mmetsp:Transcript_16495/g.27550  ORF Transcript_16495/g.27550 Transcript_16495/m.27550 type:complete len:423 (-) Transcript_16495:163-1431(-)
MSSIENIQLWETLLKKSSKSDQQSPQSDGTLLLVGDPGCGKRSLAKALSAMSPSSGVNTTDSSESDYPEFISYSYFTVGEEGQKVDVWRMGREAFANAADLVLNPVRDNNVVIAVAIDVSDADCATTLYKWLQTVNTAIDTYMSHSPEPAASSGQEETKDTGSSGRPTVLVVGCKADSLEVQELDALASSKARQGGLRAVCLHEGVSGMVFTAAAPPAGGNTTAALNCEALRELISGRLVGSSPTGIDMHIQEGTTDVIIPDTSLDSAELIRSATDVDAKLVLQSIQAAAHTTKSTTDKDSSAEGSSTTSLTSVLLEDESQWLRQFQGVEKEVPSEITAHTNDLNTSTSSAATNEKPQRRKSTTTPNPLAAVGSKSSAAAGLASLLEGKEGSTKAPRKKKPAGDKKEKKESPRGFFEDLLTK